MKATRYQRAVSRLREGDTRGLCYWGTCSMHYPGRTWNSLYWLTHECTAPADRRVTRRNCTLLGVREGSEACGNQYQKRARDSPYARLESCFLRGEAEFWMSSRARTGRQPNSASSTAGLRPAYIRPRSQFYNTDKPTSRSKAPISTAQLSSLARKHRARRDGDRSSTEGQPLDGLLPAAIPSIERHTANAICSPRLKIPGCSAAVPTYSRCLPAELLPPANSSIRRQCN
jgi:hypothetical protein